MKKSQHGRWKSEALVHMSQVEPRIDLASEVNWDEGRRNIRVVIYHEPGAPAYLDLSIEQAEALGVRLVKESYRCAALWGRGPERDNVGI